MIHISYVVDEKYTLSKLPITTTIVFLIFKFVFLRRKFIRITMASNRSSSSHVSKSDPKQIQSQTKTSIISSVSNSTISSDNVTKEKQSSLPTKRISNIEIFTCFWLDLYKTKDNEGTQKELRKIINHLETFENSDECEQAIQQTTQEKIILISSSSLARQIVSRVHDLPQFSACYIFSQDKAIDKQWTNNYTKVCKKKFQCHFNNNMTKSTKIDFIFIDKRCFHSTIRTH